MDFTKISAELAGYASNAEFAIGSLMKRGFGVETSDSANKIIFYAMIGAMILLLLRVQKVRNSYVQTKSRDRTRRFGLQRHTLG
jgi:hypothetical protein